MQRRHRPRLAAKPIDDVGPVVLSEEWNLEGDLPIQLRIQRQIHGSHSPFAEQSLNPVAAKGVGKWRGQVH